MGDDVVDLDDPANVAAHLRARFVERVLAEEERALLATSSDPRRLLWSLFAAKEAAFKVVVKARGPRVFAHRDFVVSPELHAVRYGDVALPLRVDHGAGWVHATAWTSRPPLLASVEELPTSTDPSHGARSLLCTSLARVLDCRARDLVVVRDALPGSWDGFAPPRVLRHGAPTGYDVSLSHDGRFVSCAVNSRRGRDDRSPRAPRCERARDG